MYGILEGHLFQKSHMHLIIPIIGSFKNIQAIPLIQKIYVYLDLFGYTGYIVSNIFSKVYFE